jgi:ABC-type antimicrobial peptide transport system permease subunit
VLAATIRRELLVMEPDLLFAEGAQTLEARTSTALLPARAAASGVGTVGLIAMGLAAIGLYGVIAYAVAQRTREIGLRMALGARRGAVMSLVMRQGLTVVGAGLAVGAVFGVGAARLISGVLYGISPADPLAWAGGVAVLVGSSILANAIPALRAARVEPSVALRHE